MYSLEGGPVFSTAQVYDSPAQPFLGYPWGGVVCESREGEGDGSESGSCDSCQCMEKNVTEAEETDRLFMEIVY